MAEAVILGSAQDGGVPHAGCLCINCQTARKRPELRVRPAALGIRSGDGWTLVDATQAFEEQIHMLWSRLPSSNDYCQERYRPPKTIILTHAHTGHYAGLWQLDKSVLAAPGTTILAPPLTAAMLRANEPWMAMERDGYIAIAAFGWGSSFSLADDVTVEAVEVPHRSEWPTDTAALFVQGPSARLLYLPDIDFWDEWDRNIVEVVDSVDVAILDGSFWERPTRPDVPHPPVRETMDRLQRVVDGGSTRVILTHLNHSNPLLTVGSPERREAESRGYEVATDGLAIQI